MSNSDCSTSTGDLSPVLPKATIRTLHLHFNRTLACPGLTDYIMAFLQDELARTRLSDIEASYNSSGITSATRKGSSEVYHERAGPVLMKLSDMMQGPFAASVPLLRLAFQVLFRVLQSVPDLMIGVYQQDKHWQRNEAEAANWRLVFKEYNLPVVLGILERHKELRGECCSVLYRCFMYVFRADARAWNRVYIHALLKDQGDKVIAGGKDCDLESWTEHELMDTHCLLQKMIHVLKENPGGESIKRLPALERSNKRIMDHLPARKQRDREQPTARAS